VADVAFEQSIVRAMGASPMAECGLPALWAPAPRLGDVIRLISGEYILIVGVLPLAVLVRSMGGGCRSVDLRVWPGFTRCAEVAHRCPSEIVGLNLLAASAEVQIHYLTKVMDDHRIRAALDLLAGAPRRLFMLTTRSFYVDSLPAGSPHSPGVGQFGPFELYRCQHWDSVSASWIVLLQPVGYTGSGYARTGYNLNNLIEINEDGSPKPIMAPRVRNRRGETA
jgi:hypothetical protein